MMNSHKAAGLLEMQELADRTLMYIPLYKYFIVQCRKDQITEQH